MSGCNKKIIGFYAANVRFYNSTSFLKFCFSTVISNSFDNMSIGNPPEYQRDVTSNQHSPNSTRVNEAAVDKSELIKLFEDITTDLRFIKSRLSTPQDSNTKYPECEECFKWFKHKACIFFWYFYLLILYIDLVNNASLIRASIRIEKIIPYNFIIIINISLI
ncbi:hypothetical protein DFJ63DRAFT_315607 [Scheffersomyces coipomensis]|uniref:uncharacterized protein n=1 Tax=Scheffersomyces coipomensis TaxID=1788519 RepID=UPI00315DF711